MSEEKLTIGRVAEKALRDGLSNEEVLQAVKDAFPESNTSMASVNWYRNKLRSDGESVPASRDIRRARREASKNAG
jgi:hypothetical protein